jgi:hypothetical protein
MKTTCVLLADDHAPRAIGLANSAEVRFFYLPNQVLPNSIWG